ncbi:MAG TPA: hypothetical protein VGO21_04260 [Candidatus Paceibacterota bacterium]|jgi:hypothetical protein|nr:hypothetical protein [Candidatus Paceibacterota bacterium]
MDQGEKLEWSALEYEEKTRSADWFWVLGVIIVTSAITAVIYSDYFFAVLLIMGGILLGFFATKKPEIVHYELNEKGLKIRSHFYPYENIKSFYIQRSPKTLLFIKSERLFMPIFSVPIEDALAEHIHSIMLEKNVPEEVMKEHFSEKVMEFLGF